MAAVSAAQTASSTALTPPSSSHGNSYAWDSSLQQLDDPEYAQRTNLKSHASQNGTALTYGAPSLDQPVHRRNDFGAVLGQENTRPGRSRDTDDSYDGPRNEPAKRSASVAGSHSAEPTEDNSKWIHRDKLARIESEELQAAGIIFPKSRARSRPGRDVSIDRAASNYRRGHDTDAGYESGSRKNSMALSERRPEITTPSWDLRLPDEIAEEAYFTLPYGSKGSSRIPVAKISPAPIALDQMEREFPMVRRREDSPATEDGIAYPKSRSRSTSVRPGEATGDAHHSPPRATRSTSDMSPRKASVGITSSTSAPALRKVSGASKGMPASGRPKTRNGTSKDSNSSGTGATRPSTRSGDRDSTGASGRQPEGDPPWMISAYRPDPRLPPDQQLLPTVAKRLQQEKWEREGKFGSIYDKEFRPLNDDGFLSPPEESPEKPGVSSSGSGPEAGDRHDEWPLKPEGRNLATPTPQGRTGSYSTIPKIQEKPNMSPLPSPRNPTSQAAETNGAQSAPTAVEDEKNAKDGCGCCVVM